MVGSPTAMFYFHGHDEIQCSVLQERGLSGSIPFVQCIFLQPLLKDQCNCITDNDG